MWIRHLMTSLAATSGTGMLCFWATCSMTRISRTYSSSGCLSCPGEAWTCSWGIPAATPWSITLWGRISCVYSNALSPKIALKRTVECQPELYGNISNIPAEKSEIKSHKCQIFHFVGSLNRDEIQPCGDFTWTRAGLCSFEALYPSWQQKIMVGRFRQKLNFWCEGHWYQSMFCVTADIGTTKNSDQRPWSLAVCQNQFMSAPVDTCVREKLQKGRQNNRI